MLDLILIKTNDLYNLDDPHKASLYVQRNSLMAEILGKTRIGSLASVYVADFKSICLQIGTLDPENIILCDLDLAKELLKHKGKSEDLMYSVRIEKVLGRQRKIVVLPHILSCDMKKTVNTLEYFVTILKEEHE